MYNSYFLLFFEYHLYVIGVLSLIISAILPSISQVYYANRVQAVHPFLFTGVSFLITTLYFQFFVTRQKTHVQWQQATPPLLKLNIASVLAFMGFYFALKYIESAIVSSLEMGLGPLFVIVIAIQQKQAVKRTQLIIVMGTLGACLVLIYAVFTGKSAMLDQFSILGVLASILCGLGAVLCTLYSKQLSGLAL